MDQSVHSSQGWSARAAFPQPVMPVLAEVRVCPAPVLQVTKLHSLGMWCQAARFDCICPSRPSWFEHVHLQVRGATQHVLDVSRRTVYRTLCTPGKAVHMSVCPLLTRGGSARAASPSASCPFSLCGARQHVLYMPVMPILAGVRARPPVLRATARYPICT